MLMTKSQEKRETKNFYRLVIENSGVFFNHFAMCKPKITSELSQEELKQRQKDPPFTIMIVER